MEQNDPNNIKTGKIGENIACRYLVQKGYTILERNYRRKCGEIDVVCSLSTSNPSVLHRTFGRFVPHGTKIVFVEVKSINKNSMLRPEENMTANKQRRLINVCKLYLAEKNLDLDSDWQIDVLGIVLDKENKKAKIRHIRNALSS